ACAKCQKRKTKCDGHRPQCGACAKRNDTRCEYPVREGAMSRYSDLKETFGCLERENHDLKELLSYIRHRTEREAMEVWRRLRTAEDPLQVLQYFRDADTLLLIPSSSSPANGNQKMHELELDAQARSDIKVRSRPWTIIAGDGLVSCLISSFFKWDSSILLPFIDKDLFLRDMRAGSGRYCSPFLVNSICALRSLMSDIPRGFNRAANIDLCSMFLSEAKKQLDLEAGKVSYTSVQGLFILFVLSCCDGTNRAGSIYRMAAFDMLAKLKLEKTFARLRDSVPEEAEHKRAISKLLWGLYVLECLLSHAFLKPTTLSEPKIPRMIYEGRSDSPNLDVRGLPFSSGSPEPPLVPGATEKAYSIAILYQTIMRYNTHPSLTIGGRADMDKRRDFFSQLGQLQDSLPNRLRYRHNLAPDTLFLNSLINMAAYNIVRPLHPSATIREGYTAQAVILDLCAIDVEILE
ncbi:nitrogen assimilation transcription factor nirA, partial [Cladorrhinum samala]